MSKKRKSKNKKNNSTGGNQLSIDEAIQILENYNQTNQSSTSPEFTDQSKELSHKEVEELPKSGQETAQLEQQEQDTSSITKEKSANTQKENKPTKKHKNIKPALKSSVGHAVSQKSVPIPYKEFRQKIEEKPRQAFKDAQAKYKEILDKSKSLESETEEARKRFLDSTNNDEEKKLISKSKYREYKKARQEVFNEYRQQVIDATRTGDLESIKTSKEDFSAKIRKKIAEKMYGKGTGELSEAEANAFGYFDSKYQSESYNKAIKTRKKALGKLIDEHRKIGMVKPDDLKSVMAGEKNAGGRNAAKQIEKNGFKFGKGKVAMAVMGLAGLAGVTGLMFSGGRQQNSNLYNANQAMY